MSELGYIKIDRRILENPTVCKDSDHYAVWNYLLLKATHKEIRSLFKGQEIILQPRTINNRKRKNCRTI